MEVETDGTITPEEAVDKSAKILIDYFTLLTKDGKPTPAVEAPVEEASSEKEEESKEEVVEEKKEDSKKEDKS